MPNPIIKQIEINCGAGVETVDLGADAAHVDHGNTNVGAEIDAIQSTLNSYTTTTVGSATMGAAIPADDITAWDAGSSTSISVSDGVLTVTNGSVPSLTYTAKNIPNVTAVENKTVLTVTPPSP